MSFIEEKLQTVQCDNCKNTYQDDDSGYAFWMDPNDAWECANNDGWTEENDKHYCSFCHHYNDEDELILNEKKNKMEELKQNIIDALNDATDFEYDKVNTSIFYEYLDDIFDQIPDTTAQLKADKAELLEALDKINDLVTDFTADSLMIIEDISGRIIQKHKQ